MHKRVTTLLLSSLVAGVLLAAPAQAGPFTDVPTDHWAYEAIDMLQSEGIVEGYPDGTFKGNRSFTRYEMAMVVARLYTRLNTQQDLSDYVTDEEFNEYKAMVQALMDEFQGDLDEVNNRLDELNGRVDGLEDRVSALENMKDTVTWSGAMRMRVEDIITGQSNGFNLTPGNPTTIPGPTIGQTPGASAEFEQMLYLAADAQPSDYLHVYASMWQISSDLDTPKGDVGATPSPANQSLIIDQAYAVADVNQLLGYDEGIDGWLQQAYITVGRQYNRFGAFGLTYDNYFESRPAFFLDAGDPRWELQFMVARDVNATNGGQDGLTVARASYGFGDSNREDTDRIEFARVGLNYLINGVGAEEGWSVDVDTELAGGEWFPGLKVEWFNSMHDQYGNDTDDTFGADLDQSIIAGLDIYNNGNLTVNARYASVGLPPGYSSVDNNPFEEYDALANGIGLPGLPNFNYGGESGINYFPANFEGFGATIQYTWYEKFFMDLTFYDGQLKSNEADLPAIIRLNGRYPLSENSDLGIEYIHAGIDAEPTVAKLRGEFLVRF
jgi:hypothetical protein